MTTSFQENERLLAYLTVPSAYQSQALPKRNRVTFLSKKTGLPQVWSFDTDTFAASQYVQFPDRVIDVAHSPTGTWTVIGMDHEGNEKQQLYLLNNDTMEIEELMVSPGHFHHVGGWSPCGTKIAWTSNRRGPGLFDVYVQEVETKKHDVVYQSNGKCVPLCWTSDGNHLLFLEEETNIIKKLFAVEVSSGEFREIGLKGGGRYSSVQFGRDGSGYFLCDGEENTKALYQFDVNGAAEKRIHFPDWDIEEASLSADGKTICFTVNEQGVSVLYLYDVTSATQTRVQDVPRGVIVSLSWHSSQHFFFTLKSPLYPGDIWRCDAANGEVKRITFFGRSEEIEALWKEPEICSFSSFDGLEVPYFMYQPHHPQPQTPVVVYVHGGPESQIRFDFNPVFQYLLGQGFAVVAPNVRGSLGYGKAYLNMDNGRKRMDAVADLAWLVKDLAKRDSVDSSRIGIMGRSYGGFMVLAALTHYPDLWAAGVDIVGISHFRTFLENTGEWRRKLRESEYGSLAEDSDFFEEIAPLNHSEKIKVPLLIFHGRNDTRVPVSEAEQLFSDMQQRGQDVELIVFEDEGHQTEKLDNHIALNTKVVHFFREHLVKSD